MFLHLTFSGATVLFKVAIRNKTTNIFLLFSLPSRSHLFLSCLISVIQIEKSARPQPRTLSRPGTDIKMTRPDFSLCTACCMTRPALPALYDPARPSGCCSRPGTTTAHGVALSNPPLPLPLPVCFREDWGACHINPLYVRHISGSCPSMIASCIDTD